MKEFQVYSGSKCIGIVDSDGKVYEGIILRSPKGHVDSDGKVYSHSSQVGIIDTSDGSVYNGWVINSGYIGRVSSSGSIEKYDVPFYNTIGHVEGGGILEAGAAMLLLFKISTPKQRQEENKENKENNNPPPPPPPTSQKKGYFWAFCRWYYRKLNRGGKIGAFAGPICFAVLPFTGGGRLSNLILEIPFAMLFGFFIGGGIGALVQFLPRTKCRRVGMLIGTVVVGASGFLMDILSWSQTSYFFLGPVGIITGCLLGAIIGGIVGCFRKS
jgi:hypothetical protein